MSNLEELIKINKNIENQNNEIIRLLKKIAGEDEACDGSFVESSDENIGEELYLETSPCVGEVYFIDNGDIFKLSIKNNELLIDNLTGIDESMDFNVAEIVANESINNNQCISDSTVILNDSCNGKLSEILKLCYMEGAKKVFIPWNIMLELVGAPQEIQSMIKLDFYKNTDDLLEKIFK